MPMSAPIDLKNHIRQIPDFPKPGILFYDISTLLAHPQAWNTAVRTMAEMIRPQAPDFIAGIESRGFLFGSAIAHELSCGFVMIRKVGKLPGTVISHSYDLEYGSDTLQIADGIIPRDRNVVLVDDLIATGGTAQASVQLLQKIGANVTSACFFIELDGLGSTEKLGTPSQAVLNYPA
jgi:adenine phosphoribosyltransferase